MKLNNEQREAVFHDDGPALIVAGAGTGKTAVITERIARLISQKKASPEEILALTFTDKAAGEMEDRVERLLPPSYIYSDIQISTFHSFGERLLRTHGLDIGLPVGFKLLEETGAWMLVKRNLDRFKLDYYKPAGSPTKFISAMISHFSRCKDEMISPEDYLTLSKKNGSDAKRLKEVALAYQSYQDLLLKNGYLDFGDLIGYSVKLLKERPLILEKYRDLFKYLVVDEFQDTNRVQYELLRLISHPKGNITICLDGNQAIYRWRGASSGNVAEFQKDYPKAKKIVLSKNYRSLQNILDLSHKFMDIEGAEHLKAVRKGKGQIGHLHFKTLDYELRGITGEIFRIMENDRDCRFDNIAVLTRTNNDADLITTACERTGIPCRFLSMRGLYRKSVILDVISYFKLLDNYHENSAVYRILNLPFLAIPPEEIAKMTQYSYRKARSIYSVLLETQSVPELTPKTVKKIEQLAKMIKEHSLLSVRKRTSDIFISFLTDSKYLNYLDKEKDLESIDYINQFFDRIQKFEESNPGARLKDFMEELTLEMESGESGTLSPGSDDDGSVKVMTVHSAKGLEFKYVIIANMVDRRFPGNEKSELIEMPKELTVGEESKDDHLREERRLFYVAITRAMDGLVFTSAENYGGTRKKKLSRFLIELGFHEKVPSETKTRYDKVKEKRLKRIPELPEYFSFTQLAAYSSCPLQYMYAHLLKIPVRNKPSQVFGKSMHNAISEITKERLKKKLSLNDAFEIYDSSWVDDWYDSRKQRAQYYRAGKKAIRRFFKEFKDIPPPIVLISGKPALEQKFKFKFQEYSLNGKIDRIDEMGERVEIIDYKTGTFKPNLPIGGKEQLIIYQMAVEQAFKMKVGKLTYYYLNEGRKLSFTANEKDKKRVIERIIDKARAIKKMKFEPNSGWHCRYCDFKDICEYAKR